MAQVYWKQYFPRASSLHRGCCSLGGSGHSGILGPTKAGLYSRCDTAFPAHGASHSAAENCTLLLLASSPRPSPGRWACQTDRSRVTVVINLPSIPFHYQQAIKLAADAQLSKKIELGSVGPSPNTLNTLAVVSSKAAVLSVEHWSQFYSYRISVFSNSTSRQQA